MVFFNVREGGGDIVFKREVHVQTLPRVLVSLSGTVHTDLGLGIFFCSYYEQS